MSPHRFSTLFALISIVCLLASACSDDPGSGANDDTDTGVDDDAGHIDDAGPGDAGVDDTGPDEDTGPDVDAGPDDDVGPDVGDECPDGEELCGDDCVDLSEDVDHCGDCDDACPDDPNGDVSCDAGTCVLDCDEGYTDCGGECVDTLVDDDHCGQCDNECDGDASCDFGACFDGPECDGLGDPFGGGSGSASDPYLICTFEQLANVDDHLTDHFVLRADLDFAATDVDFQQDFEPLAEAGTFASQFEGSLDGMGRTISNLEFDEPNTDNVGLFRAIDTSGVVENLHLENPTVEGNNRTGALAGENHGQVTNVTASDVDVVGTNSTGGLVGRSNRTIESADITGIVEGGFSVGGLVGTVENGDVVDSEAHVAVEASSRRAGGLVGTLDNGTVENSHATGDAITLADNNTAGGLVANVQASTSKIIDSWAEGDVEADLYVGGLAGVNEGLVENSYATGDAEGTENVGGFVGTNRGEIDGSHATGDAEGDASIGGFVGHHEDGEITDSWTDSTVVAVGTNAGGFVGLGEARIRRSFATGVVNPQPQPAVSNVGGFAGQMLADVYDSYALGDVQGNENVGGFVGDLSAFGFGADGLIHACYSFGEPTGSEDVGGLVGSDRSATISASYWNVDTSGTTDSDGGQALTDDQFADQSVFDDPSDPNDAWNFEDTWEMDSSEERPVLQWE